MEEERDPEHHDESKNVRPSRAVHGPLAKTEYHLVLPEEGPYREAERRM